MNEIERERLNKLKQYENNIFAKNDIQHIAGIDEAGRGPLAGPVVVGCVILNRNSFIEGINDSKKVSEKKRELLYQEITRTAVDWSIGIVDEKEIDEINILNATKKAVTLAVSKLKIKPDLILVDALTNINTLQIPYEGIIKGDSKIYSIAAGSIIAKVTRDRIIMEYDKIYPQYGFASHKGYGTAKHIQAIKEYGICDIHRRTFIKNFI